MYLCACVIYPYDPPVWWPGVDYETHRELIPTGSGRVTLSSHLGFCSPLWNSRNDWTFIQSLPASVNRTSGRLKKLPFVTWHKDALILSKPYIEYWANGARAKVHLKNDLFFIYLFPNQATNLHLQMCEPLMRSSSRLAFSDIKYQQQCLLSKQKNQNFLLNKSILLTINSENNS